MEHTVKATCVIEGEKIISLVPPRAAIVDIDGTIADVTHRLHFIQKQPKDWESFQGPACRDDAPIGEWITLVKLLGMCGWSIYYITGRREMMRADTLEWLNRHGLPEGPLMMRPDNDYRRDTEIKEEHYHDLQRLDVKVELVLEDRFSVCEMWRGLGLNVIQVVEGDY